ncbi:MAG: sigma-70 family RNA polymerase sigma factor [Rubrobacter sp.]|nr:sigma-70 family RNA polymerase sigma factor [Rubrobacter sp.]
MEEFMDWKNLEQQSERWRDSEKTLREIRRHLKRDPRSVKGVFDAAEENRLVYKHHLFHVFHVRADTMEVVEGLKPSATSLKRRKDLIMSGAAHGFYSDVLEVRDELSKRRSEDLAARFFPKFRRSFLNAEDSYEVAARKVLALYDEQVTLFYDIWSVNRDLLRARGLTPRQRRHARELTEWAEGRLVSFLDAKTSLDKNPRLGRAVEKNAREAGLSSWQQKLLELTSVTPLAFAEREPGEPIRPGTGKPSVVSRAGRLVEETGTEQTLKPERFEVVPDSPEAGRDDEELLEHEDDEAQRQNVDRLADEAGLPKRQRQAFELRHKEGLDFDRIAEEMGTATKTAYRNVEEAEGKVREAVLR